MSKFFSKGKSICHCISAGMGGGGGGGGQASSEAPDEGYFGAEQTATAIFHALYPLIPTDGAFSRK